MKFILKFAKDTGYYHSFCIFVGLCISLDEMIEVLLDPYSGWFYVFLVFCLVTLIQLIFFWGFFSRLAFLSKKKKLSEHQPVSVVVCARNEYYNLKRNLPQLLDQKYDDFEVVVVNDSSDDETDYLLKTFCEQYPNLSIVNFRQNLNFFKGKKFPLALGIKSAKNDILLLTDADCRPNSPYWIREMQSNFTDSTAVVLGYGKYESQPGLLNKLIRFDTAYIAMQYLSFALAGTPYMGVGRNLAYRKSLFYSVGGFISHYQMISGDDDLFVNQVANGKNTRVEVLPDSHTVSTAKTDFSTWAAQKRRHLTTGYSYKIRHKFLLGLFSGTAFLFYALAIGLAIHQYNLYLILALFVLRLITSLVIFKKTMSRLEEKKLLLYLPLFEIFFLIFNPLLSIAASVLKENKWK